MNIKIIDDIKSRVKTVNGNVPDAAGNVVLGTANGIVPVGSVIAFAANFAPDGYLICNGAEISRETYAALYAAIGTTYGEGDGSTTFTLPNLTDRFIQGSSTAGTVKAAGLPNITGNGCAYTGFVTPSDSIYKDDRYSKLQYAEGASYGVRSWSFDASKSNSVYGNSNTVQPPALTMCFYIKY